MEQAGRTHSPSETPALTKKCWCGIFTHSLPARVAVILLSVLSCITQIGRE